MPCCLLVVRVTLARCLKGRCSGTKRLSLSKRVKKIYLQSWRSDSCLRPGQHQSIYQDINQYTKQYINTPMNTSFSTSMNTSINTSASTSVRQTKEKHTITAADWLLPHAACLWLATGSWSSTTTRTSWSWLVFVRSDSQSTSSWSWFLVGGAYSLLILDLLSVCPLLFFIGHSLTAAVFMWPLAVSVRWRLPVLPEEEEGRVKDEAACSLLCRCCCRNGVPGE